jgi:hypothetical protein
VTTMEGVALIVVVLATIVVGATSRGHQRCSRRVSSRSIRGVGGENGGLEGDL